MASMLNVLLFCIIFHLYSRLSQQAFESCQTLVKKFVSVNHFINLPFC